MSSLVRASAVGVVALALVVPSGATAAAKKPKHTVTVNQVDVLPKTTSKNLNRKCGKSKSATKIRKRSTSRPTKNRVRTVTYYCSGGTRTQLWIKKLTKTVTVPGPVVTVPAKPAPAAGAPRASGSRCCTTTTVSPSTASATRSTATAASPASRPCSTACAARPTLQHRRPACRQARQGHGHVSSGDNFLAGLNLRPPSSASTPARARSTTRSRSAASATTRSRSATTSTTSGPTRLAQLIGHRASGVAVPDAPTPTSAR